jgi:dTDP-glucose 4,6-dehydratase/UDP-glucuronate decarboxylase
MATNAEEVVREDLDYMCRSLAEEFAQIGNKRLLVVGGAGFLGYYLVQSVLHWNAGAGKKSPIRLTVYDNYMRGVPPWLSALSGDPNLELVKHDIRDPLPANIPDFQYIVHGGSIASPVYYRKFPIETMDANVNGLRSLLEYTKHRKQQTKPVEGFLFYSSSEIYGDPTPDSIPTPETYRGYVSCTGPRACYDESKRYQLRAGAQDQRSASVAGLRARRAGRSRHRDAFGRQPAPHLLLRGRRRHRLLQSIGQRQARRGLQRRRRKTRDLDGRARRARRGAG